MTTDIIDMKLLWLLSVAERVKSIFASSAESDTITDIIKSTVDADNAIVAHNMVASDGYNFMIISADPHQLFIKIINNIKATNDTSVREELNPNSIITQLVNSEYRLDTGSSRLCYGLKSPVPSNYLLKIIACRTIASAQSYNKCIDQESFTLLEEKIKEIHPLFDYATNSNRVIGGKKRTFTKDQKNRGRERLEIIAQLVEYVKKNKNISEGIIFVDELSDCSSSAISILYTEFKYKEAINDYLKILIANKYPKFSYKSFLHAEFSIPYDYRIKKHSCLINDKLTKKPTYIANLYNSATYNVIPCTRINTGNTSIIMAHPIIKLWISYIDMYTLECKKGEISSPNYEALNINKMTNIFNDLSTFDKYPHWIGIYLEERYEKLQYNMRSKENKPAETFYI